MSTFVAPGWFSLALSVDPAKIPRKGMKVSLKFFEDESAEVVVTGVKLEDTGIRVEYKRAVPVVDL